MLGMCSANWTSSRTVCLFVWFFFLKKKKTGSHFVNQAGPECTEIHLPLPRTLLIWTLCHPPVILQFKKQRQEDHYRFKANVVLRPTRLYRKTLPQKCREKQKYNFCREECAAGRNSDLLGTSVCVSTCYPYTFRVCSKSDRSSQTMF